LSLNFWVQDTFDMLPQLGWVKTSSIISWLCILSPCELSSIFQVKKCQMEKQFEPLPLLAIWNKEEFDAKTIEPLPLSAIWNKEEFEAKQENWYIRNESKSLLPYHEFGYHNSGA
jgi:hypothetical protein